MVLSRIKTVANEVEWKRTRDHSNLGHDVTQDSMIWRRKAHTTCIRLLNLEIFTTIAHRSLSE